LAWKYPPFSVSAPTADRAMKCPTEAVRAAARTLSLDAAKKPHVGGVAIARIGGIDDDVGALKRLCQPFAADRVDAGRAGRRDDIVPIFAQPPRRAGGRSGRFLR
jgi:hypothetical protein